MHAKIAVAAVMLLGWIACSHSPTMAPAPFRTAGDSVRITTPLRPDGTPDYLEAYNARLPRIAPDENAFTFIFQATGAFDQNWQKKMLAVLHLPAFQKDARFLQSLSQFERTLHPAKPGQPFDSGHDVAGQLEDGMNQRLLIADEQSLVSQWLDAQAQPVKLLEHAADLKACVIPLCARDDEHVVLDALPVVSALMRCVEPFCARANLRAARGDFAGAQQDLVTALRLARLVQQTPLLIVRLMGAAGEMRVCKTARMIALSAPMTAEQLRSLAHALADVPAAPTLAETYNLGERFCTLDMYTQIARGKGAHLLRLDLMIFDDSTPLDEGDLDQVDWNVLLRSADRSFDDSAKVFSSTDWRTIRQDLRKEASTQPAPANIPFFPASNLLLPTHGNVDFAQKWAKERADVLAFFHRRSGESREQFTDRIGQFFSGPKALEEHFANLLITRALEFPLTQTTLALAAFHAEHHAWPDSLGALVPQYVPAEPEDSFSENPLRYHTTAAGFVLYSVGPNHKDDSGIKDDKKSQDDIAVSCPILRLATNPDAPR